MDSANLSDNPDVKAMLQDAIMALQAASAAGHEATSKIQQQANHPELKEALQQGSKYSGLWRDRLSAALTKVGGSQSPAASGNPVIDAIQQVGGKIIQKTSNPDARDLGIIASGQLALHYYIAAFGTMTAYAKRLGMPEIANLIHECMLEAKQGDGRYTQLAAKIGA